MHNILSPQSWLVSGTAYKMPAFSLIKWLPLTTKPSGKVLNIPAKEEVDQ